MITLGIHDGHTATACLAEDGQVLACISEERLNGEKEWMGFPGQAIGRCLAMTGREAGDVDAVGVCSLLPQTGHRTYHRPPLSKRLFGAVVRVAPGALLQREGNARLVQSVGQALYRGRRRDYEERLAAMGFRCPPAFYEHHHLHAATAYYTNWYRPERCLVLTLDGSGDAVSGTVQIGEGGRLKRVASHFNYNSICEFYTKITQFLGMKPMSHEFKVMGLAPYAGDERRDALLEVFRRFYRISAGDPLQIVNTSGRWKWQFLDAFPKLLAGRRFDIIAGAVQELFEEVVLQWVKNAVAATGIGDVALSGGGFMNVKLNGLILDQPEVNSLFVFPSCGDESNPIGAALLAAIDQGLKAEEIPTLGMLDWGPSYDMDAVRRVVKEKLPAEGFTVSEHDDIDGHTGRQVALGKITGRFSGRMEWGARALGQRSIVADPRDPGIIHRINKAIKMRDFWMPFAPAVLEEYRDRYLQVRSGFRSPFMTAAYETTAEARRDLPAGLHPFDSTARAQIVNAGFHPGFHRLISAFAAETGSGAVLNTSFNIHGDPIVCSPEDAVRTLVSSDLDALQMENLFIERIRP